MRPIIAVICSIMLAGCTMFGSTGTSVQDKINDVKILLITFSTQTNTNLKRGTIDVAEAEKRLVQIKEVQKKIQLAETLLDNNDPASAQAQMNLIGTAIIYMQNKVQEN